MAEALKGACLCGACTLTATPKSMNMGACHCSMCRKWSGGIYLGTTAAPDAIHFKGTENITTYTSSPWAERAFCKICGSNLYYRVTAPGPQHGTYHFGFGTLDTPGDAKLTGELFIDLKPSGYSFAEPTHAMTEAEVLALFASED